LITSFLNDKNTCSIPHRVISFDTLKSMQKTHPFEAAACEILIERGAWSLETEVEGAEK